MTGMDGLWDLVGISAAGAVAVTLGTTVLYVAFLLLTRLLGQRVLAGLSGFDLVVVIIAGAIVGRATLGPLPTASSGLVALVTLLTLEGLVGQLRRAPRWNRLLNNDAVLLMAGSALLSDTLSHYRITEAELRSRLRRAGIRNDDEVAAVILEPTGELSVLRRGFLVDPAMLRDVRGADRMPGNLLGM